MEVKRVKNFGGKHFGPGPRGKYSPYPPLPTQMLGLFKREFKLHFVPKVQKQSVQKQIVHLSMHVHSFQKKKGKRFPAPKP